MPTILQDREFYQAGIAGLEAYLLSNELFWPLSGGQQLPRLTVGGMLLAGLRLRARTTEAGEQATLDKLGLQLGEVRTRWRSAWERKAAREVHTSFTLWRNYLDDYRQSPELRAEEYSSQVQERVVLHLLGRELSPQPEELNVLPGLDRTLKGFLLPGGFVWEPDLAAAFPAGEYWFLYGKLKSS